MPYQQIHVSDYAPEMSALPFAKSQLSLFAGSSLLNVRGNISALVQMRKKTLGIAVIGTRKPSLYGLQVVQKLMGLWRHQPFSVVSGGAYGIDGEAHERALENGLATRAWLVGPLENPSPQSHRRLFGRIENQPGSALLVPNVLEPVGAQPLYPSMWLERNLWVAADAHCAVVVEADLNSGTWSTVKAFNDLGRDVFVVPGPVFAPRSRGTNAMISKSYGNIVADLEELTQTLVVAAQQNSYNI